MSKEHDLHEMEVYDKTILGFWIYLLTDFVFFGILFASYAVLVQNPFGGATPRELFNLPFVLIQTLILLTSSFVFSIASSYVYKKKRGMTLLFLTFSFFLGVLFLVMQLSDYGRLIKLGYNWQTNGFLSTYFTLLGIHSVHLIFGLVWFFVLGIPVAYHGLKPVNIKRLTCLKMFWQFVNIIWIFIFSFVYLIGAS
jgi:cytochrome o ubiquinol oxidase subunit 3